MKLDVFIDIRDRIDSRTLWNRLEDTGINVTDLGTHTLVYGTIEQKDLTRTIATCQEFGDSIATISPPRH